VGGAAAAERKAASQQDLFLQQTTKSFSPTTPTYLPTYLPTKATADISRKKIP
jgi:hypothetical protein